MESLPGNKVCRVILRWYDQNKRDLPWRKTRDPYAIWISEVMLQQTQVKTVLPYYRRFLKSFPALRALDRAPSDRVMALWSGLGYYRRAENLKRAARLVMKKHGGKMPQTFSALRTLPGVGDYTAGAVASIAFNQVVPALDGNARRVLRRLFHAPNSKALQALAKDLISPLRPGDFNQGLMDLGAEVCRARAPDCRACPCSSMCMARRSGLYEIPRPARQAQTAAVTWPLGVITQKGKVLLRRRPQQGLLGGLWEVPGGKQANGNTSRRALARQFENLKGIVDRMTLVGEVRHSITRYRIRAPVFFCSTALHVLPRGDDWRWIPLSSIARYPISALSAKAIRLVTQRSRFSKKP